MNELTIVGVDDALYDTLLQRTAAYRLLKRNVGPGGENAMKLLLLLAIASFAMTVASQIEAQQLGPVPEGCFRDLSGKISCPPIGGEIHVNLSGQAVCGKGRCVRDLFGKVTCSSQPAGQVTQDVTGKIICAGSCEEASAANCQQLK
jgi:hypothetical protein